MLIIMALDWVGSLPFMNEHTTYADLINIFVQLLHCAEYFYSKP